MADSPEDRMQRALNEQKRKELEEKYGARFSFDSAEAPPGVIRQWLEAVEEFERQFQDAGRTTVRAYAGNPDVPFPASLSTAEFPRELRRLIDHLQAHAIAVHFDRSVPAREAYRFIVEELFNVEIDDVRIDGLTHNFVYEDFHPDDAACATMFAGHFLCALLARDAAACVERLDSEELYGVGGEPATAGEMSASIGRFLDGIALFTGSDVTGQECTIAGRYATVRFGLSWTGLQAVTMRPLSASGIASVRLRRRGVGWRVVHVECPGWSH